MIQCSKCSIHKEESDFYKRPSGRHRQPCKMCDKDYVTKWRESNKQQRNEYVRLYYNSNKIRESQKDYARRLKSRWNISLEQYEDMLKKQDYSCAICGTDDPGGGRARFCVDHDHSCCKEAMKSCGSCIRGLLCISCNRILGLAHDKMYLLASAASYLNDFNEKKENQC